MWNARHAWSVGEILTAANHNNNDADLDLVVSTRWRKTTAKTVNNTVTETDLLNGEITIDANAMTTSGVLRLTAWGDLLQNTGGTTSGIEIKLKLGSSTLLDTGAGTAAQMIAASASRWGWRIVAEIMNLGAANAQWANIRGDISAVANNGGQTAFATGEGTYWAPAAMPSRFAGGNSGTVDTTAAQLLALTVINPTASASMETKLLGAIVEVA